MTSFQKSSDTNYVFECSISFKVLNMSPCNKCNNKNHKGCQESNRDYKCPNFWQKVQGRVEYFDLLPSLVIVELVVLVFLLVWKVIHHF